MKINKEKLKNQVEEAISYGAGYSEEVDLTTKKVMDIIQPLIIAVEQLGGQELIQQIEAMMSENETIKSNALTARIATQSPAAAKAYNDAKAENNAYLKILNLIKL